MMTYFLGMFTTFLLFLVFYTFRKELSAVPTVVSSFMSDLDCMRGYAMVMTVIAFIAFLF